MSLSFSVQGIVPPDDKWKKMKAIWDACESAGVKAPPEVIEFFDDCRPDGAGVVVKIAAKEWSNDYAWGYEVDLTKLPTHVKTIRFSVSS